ncbi:unnamed protein product [Vicia faba]|uniref:60S ribosomal protein L10P insertion domain-containing protein n=1 Tax=Vicia faba TaxID=3906 RepID=A0AAV0Z1C5_VICFA|nr:unnamed protein product [Vicia faba]
MLLFLLATQGSIHPKPLSSRFSIFPQRINKGTAKIITPVELVKKGDKVGSSEATLLAKMGIKPFSYGLVVLSVYDNGSVFRPEVLGLTDDDLVAKFSIGVSMVTSLSLAISYPTLAVTPADITYAKPVAAKEQKKVEGLLQSGFVPLRDIF